ncbi:probable prolyl 4-hydroxylase 10 [Paramuricea clavata]|uniref:Probable prolyl 4-hydroxylase 10 n=1 Tax=Paramuricea clavata TaxID=317549 RepID=A0A6S7IAY3_PARCT|nr:probable prolyl 4-hydroxylase 10 [Paramuricea clavata]
MTKQQTRKRASQTNGVSGKNVKQSRPRSRLQATDREESKSGVNYLRFACIGVIVLCMACSVVLLWKNQNFDSGANSTQQNVAQKDETNPPREHSKHDDVKSGNKKETETSRGFPDSEVYKNFRPHILNKLQVKSTNVAGTTVKVKPLHHSHKDSSVRAYVLEKFLSAYECDALAGAHDSHVTQTSKRNPLLCFDSVKTFRQNLKEVGLKIQVSSADFLEGTTCINESLSLLVRKHGLKWSYSTSFYPGESKFSLTLQERIKQATGLAPENGGKFQITSYPRNVGYKNHTDCVLDQEEKRDRYATILVYLKDVAEGGETVFPELGLSVTPKKGLALVWNSMTEDGQCDPSSIHNAAQVIQGHKYILQRWYYYQNFPSLGKRMPEPSLPNREANQPRVSCDQYEFGSCRWYDEWNYDHITEYVRNQHKYV